MESLNGYLCLVERLWERGSEFAQGWNFGPNEEGARPVAWIVEHLTSLWDENACWELDLAQSPREANYLKLDCSKAKTLLRRTPKLQLSAVLEWTVEWYRGYQANQDMRYLTESQIMRYENMGAT